MSRVSKRLEFIKQEDNGQCLTLSLQDEDHTLGNSLRCMIMKNPDVKFCGYSMPHPNERTVIMQIQTYHEIKDADLDAKKKKVTAKDCFKKGLHDLIDACEHVKSTFKDSFEKFKETTADETME